MQVVVYRYLCLREPIEPPPAPLLVLQGATDWLNWHWLPSASMATCASRGHYECVRFHVRSGTSIDADEYEHASTALHHVIRTDSGDARTKLPAMCALIALGADVNCVDDRWDSPLHLVARLGVPHVTTELAQLLLDNGADVNARRCGGYTPLHYAASGSDAPLVALLLARGADFEAGLEGEAGSLITPLKLMRDYSDIYNLATEALLVQHERVTFGRKTYAAYRELALVFVGTRLPTYVVLWILDFLPEFTDKRELCKIRLLERVWRSYRSAICTRQ